MNNGRVILLLINHFLQFVLQLLLQLLLHFLLQCVLQFLLQFLLQSLLQLLPQILLRFLLQFLSATRRSFLMQCSDTRPGRASDQVFQPLLPHLSSQKHVEAVPPPPPNKVIGPTFLIIENQKCRGSSTPNILQFVRTQFSYFFFASRFTPYSSIPVRHWRPATLYTHTGLIFSRFRTQSYPRFGTYLYKYDRRSSFVSTLHLSPPVRSHVYN